MSQYFRIHPKTPQQRLIKQAVSYIQNGDVIIYPTDSGYALGCHIGDKAAMERLTRIRQLEGKHPFTLMCSDIKQASVYARFDTPAYRLLKGNTPGAYTFVLQATREVPRRLMHPKRKTIGIRIPDCAITLALLRELGEPMLTTTLIPPGGTDPLFDPDEIRDQFQHQVNLIIDGGHGSLIPTTVIDLLGEKPIILREGLGDVTPFLI
ncbi:threonylcarbamoyl-AMP synthase [candidate division KSB1 bacterium]|nr:threonylcarbamoyl-AMP synthase [candidate division KSB1 bacterium]